MKTKNINYITPLTLAIAYAIGEGEDEKTFTQADLDAAISAAVTKANDDANAKFNEAKSGLLADLKKAKDAAKAFDGLDAEKVKGMLSAFENDQDLNDIAEGRHENVITRRMEKERAQFKSDLAGLQESTGTLETENANLKTKVSKLLIDNNVVSEFVKEKGLESGIPDVVLRANSIFKVEGDDLIARDSSGEIITGKSGPMTIQEWVSGLKESAPHLFPGSSGAGGSGGKGGQDGNAMSEKIEAAAKSGDMVEYRRLRKLQKEGKTA